MAPLLDMQLKGPTGKTIEDAALIDTGASSSAFPLHWMAALDIKQRQCKKRPLVTAAGMATQQHFPGGVDAVILDHNVRLEANFLDIPVALLGRNDFLMHFRVTFDQRKEHFVVEVR